MKEISFLMMPVSALSALIRPTPATRAAVFDQIAERLLAVSLRNDVCPARHRPAAGRIPDPSQHNGLRPAVRTTGIDNRIGASSAPGWRICHG